MISLPFNILPGALAPLAKFMLENQESLPFCRGFSRSGKTDSVASKACGGVRLRTLIHRFSSY